MLWLMVQQAAQAFAHPQQPEPLECGMYIGESTIPGAGLGIFTGIDLKIGDEVGHGDVCIPIVDYSTHNQHPRFNPFEDYVWGGEVMGMKMESATGDIEALCPGLDCVVNCNMALLNVAKAIPEYDVGSIHRSTSPGAGAISPYTNGTTRVIRDVPVGGELFKSYGESWFRSREHFSHIPLPPNYRVAQSVVNAFGEIADKHSMHEQPVLANLYSLLLDFRKIWKTRTANAIPPTFEEGLLAVEKDIGATHQPAATRSIEWLNENAKCVDHIIPKDSTIPDAGRGAFAKRNLPKGTVITGSPLHHYPKRELLMMTQQQVGLNEQDGQQQSDESTRHQLLLNYCFGHRESSVLLCPYGVGINYINHNKTLANVQIRWAEDGTSNQRDEWLSFRPNEMAKEVRSRLGFDYVATRDIQDGEELFLDYGDEWEAAWLAHQEAWGGRVDTMAERYVSAYEWNRIMYDVPLRTEDECFFDPYPENLQLRCHYRLLDDETWEDHMDKMKWDSLNDYGYPCNVVDRVEYEGDGMLYEVRITKMAKDRWDKYEGEEDYVIEDVPRSAISFADVPYSTDMHMSVAFRREIGIPDEMVPAAWKQ